MSVQRPSKTLPRERAHSNRKSNRPRMDPNLSFLQHSSAKASSPRVTFQLHMASTIRNVNPEKSMSAKGRRPYHSKVSARRSGKRPTKPLREVSEFVLFDNEISLSSAMKEQQRLNESLMRTSTLRDLAGDSDREKLIRDLQTNSLQLFQLGERNIAKRMKLLLQFEARLKKSWARLLEVLSTADNRDREVVDEAVKNLVGQRLFLERQIASTGSLLEDLRL